MRIFFIYNFHCGKYRLFNGISACSPRHIYTGNVYNLFIFKFSRICQDSYVTLDDLNERQLAITGPALFLQTHKPPLIIDEIQYAPELFPYIKMAVDKSKKKGEFWLTGSQKFQLMKGINESLAGRIAIIDLLGFSEKEKDRMATKQKPFIPTAEWIQNSSEFSKSFDVEELYKRIWLGSFPALISTPDTPRDVFYNSYIQTYIERDVKDILNVSNSISFYNFIRSTAARTGQLLNYADLARDIDIDTKTAKAWLSVLETSGLVKLLPPYHNNLTKRIIKTPKLYFLDTGLTTFLTGWDSPTSLSNGAVSGAILGTQEASKICKKTSLAHLVNISEMSVSAFIAWLTDPNKYHGMGNEFILLLLKNAGKKFNKKDFNDCVVMTEVVLENNCRLDIVVFSPKNNTLIVIENKYGAKESINQLDDYEHYLDSVPFLKII